MGPTAQKRRPPPDNFIVEPENFHKLRSWIHTHLDFQRVAYLAHHVSQAIAYASVPPGPACGIWG